ncbi:MAG: hypothetical protein ABSA05_16035 [Opitutaceae bacterium]|jgi:hypothetical protein
MPAIPTFPGLGTRRRLKWAFGSALTALLWVGSPRTAGAEEAATWDPISPADLAETQSAANPEAPAAVLFWKIEIDDRDLVPTGRHVTEYIRYKVYDPSRTEDITRIAGIEESVEGTKVSDVTIRGRLTLPDGTVREIGQDSIHERPLLRRATEDTFLQRLFGSEGAELKEQFVAVEGIKPGSVLEFRTDSNLRLTYNFIKNLQKLNIPVRHVDCTVDLFQGKEFNGAAFSANPTGLTIDQSFDQKRAVYHVSASNLPPLVDEPMAPTVNSRSLTVFDYEDNTMLALRHPMNSVRTVAADGPWAPVAAKVGMIEADATLVFAQAQVNEAKTVVAGAASETEKARRIHNFVHDLYMKFRVSVAAKGPVVSHFADMPLDFVMDFDKHPNGTVTAGDFLWLEIAMDRAFGIESQAVLLPNRNVMPFNPRLPSALFVPQIAARVKVDGAWKISLPNLQEWVPFGWVPARFQNGVALVAHDGKQEFVDVPYTPAAQSTIEETGSFALNPDGSLEGHGHRRLTGEPAIALRPRQRDATDSQFQAIVARRLKTQFPSAEIKVTSVAGLGDPDVPLEFDFDLKWPAYATATKTRLIFLPFAIHGQAPPQFSASERKYSVEFPFRWREIDDVSLQLPAGYELESPTAPPSAVVGDVLSYKVSIGAADAKGIRIRRDFVSDLSGVPATAYPTLKKWYDMVAQGDMHELVIAKAKPAAAPVPSSTQ